MRHLQIIDKHNSQQWPNYLKHKRRKQNINTMEIENRMVDVRKQPMN